MFYEIVTHTYDSASSFAKMTLAVWATLIGIFLFAAIFEAAGAAGMLLIASL